MLSLSISILIADRGSVRGASDAAAAAGNPKAPTPRQSPKTQSESGVGMAGPSRASASGKQQQQQHPAQKQQPAVASGAGAELQTNYGRRKLPDSREEEQSVVSALVRNERSLTRALGAAASCLCFETMRRTAPRRIRLD